MLRSIPVIRVDANCLKTCTRTSRSRSLQTASPGIMTSRLSAPIVVLLAVNLGLTAQAGWCQALPFGVTRIGTEEGLSSDVVTSLLVDSRGFLWVGTVDGLNRYDGYEFRIYRSDPNDSLGLSYNWITDISEDRSGYLWISTTSGGLCRLDPFADTFSCYRASLYFSSTSLARDAVYQSIQDRFQDNVFWVATARGLDRLDVSSGTVEHFDTVDPSLGIASCDPGPGNCIWTRSLYQDRRGIVWVGVHTHGLGRFDPASRSFTFYPEVLAGRGTSAYPHVLSLYESPWRPDTLWVGVKGGLRAVDMKTGAMRVFDLPASASTSWLHASREYEAGEMWFGYDGGLLRSSEDGNELRVVLDMKSQPAVRAIARDLNGLLWLGTWGEGLYKFDPDSHLRRRVLDADGGWGFGARIRGPNPDSGHRGYEVY